MKQIPLLFVACLSLTACGLGETAVSTAAGAKSEAQQVQEGLKTEERVKQQLAEAAALDAEHRRAAEANSQ